MIKLILSDLDGTLLPYGQNEMTDRLLNQIGALKEKGILFCPASGRTFPSLKRLFRHTSKDIYFLGENGAVVFDGNENLLGKTVMPKETAIRIAYDFYNETDGLGEILISGEQISYLICRETTLEQRKGNYTMEERLTSNGNKIVKINKPEDVLEDIIKVSVFVGAGIAPYAKRFENRYGDIKPTIAGPYWLDSMQATKATGVDILSSYLKIDKSEMLAFGDNFNDVPMLDNVGIPFIMSNSHEDLKKRYPNHTDNPEDIIDDIINDRFKL